MSNLTVENIAGMIRGGDAEAMIGGSSATGGAPISDARIQQVMRDQGMQLPDAPGAAGGPEAPGFSKVLQDSIGRVNQDQADADRAIKELVAGRNKNMHEVMLTLEKADSSLKLAMSVRNKVLEAYKEIMRMQV